MATRGAGNVLFLSSLFMRFAISVFLEDGLFGLMLRNEASFHAIPRQLGGVVAMEVLSVSGRRKTCSAGHWTATCVLHALEFWTRSSFCLRRRLSLLAVHVSRVSRPVWRLITTSSAWSVVDIIGECQVACSRGDAMASNVLSVFYDSQFTGLGQSLRQ